MKKLLLGAGWIGETDVKLGVQAINSTPSHGFNISHEVKLLKAKIIGNLKMLLIPFGCNTETIVVDIKENDGIIILNVTINGSKGKNEITEEMESILEYILSNYIMSNTIFADPVNLEYDFKQYENNNYKLTIDTYIDIDKIAEFTQAVVDYYTFNATSAFDKMYNKYVNGGPRMTVNMILKAFGEIKNKFEKYNIRIGISDGNKFNCYARYLIKNTNDEIAHAVKVLWDNNTDASYRDQLLFIQELIVDFIDCNITILNNACSTNMDDYIIDVDNNNTQTIVEYNDEWDK